MDDIHYSSEYSSWATPNKVFDKLNEEFAFTLDPCATSFNACCKKFYTEEQNGLVQNWEGERVFCNPPYGRDITGMWVRKLAQGGAELAVGLLPARTDTIWFHAFILGKAEIRFIKGRIKFAGADDSAPFPSMIVIWR